MYEITLLLTAMLIGLMGSGHCLAMCGGIAGAHSFSVDTGKPPSVDTIATSATASRAALLPQLLVFNLGRLCSYSLIGFLAGFIGAALALNLTLLVVLRSFAGVMLILMGLYVGQWWSGLVHLEKAGGALWAKLNPLARRLQQNPAGYRGFFLGLLWGWLPCGLVYSSLAWSMTSADPGLAALLMFSFGVGTLPSMLSAGLFAYTLRRLLSRLSVRRVFAAALIVFGIWSLPVPWSGLLSGTSHQHGAVEAPEVHQH